MMKYGILHKNPAWILHKNSPSTQERGAILYSKHLHKKVIAVYSSYNLLLRINFKNMAEGIGNCHLMVISVLKQVFYCIFHAIRGPSNNQNLTFSAAELNFLSIHLTLNVESLNLAVSVEACVSHYRLGWHILPLPKKVMREMCDASHVVGGHRQVSLQ